MSSVLNQLVVPIRSDKYSLNVQVTRSLASVKSEFQQIDIVDSECFGRMLLLDGHIQFTMVDEHAYHEALVHIPAMSVARLKRALVVGGGDGGVIRELCRHKGIEQIDMVEIDQAVIDACMLHLPEISGGAFDDPRVSLNVTDAFPFVKQAEAGIYDLIILDSTDTYEDEEGEISEMLFTQEFYKDCKRLLAPGGLVVTQADNLLFCPYSLDEIHEQFSKVFPNTGSFWSIVPSFGSFSGFFWASVDASISQTFEPNKAPVGLKYLNATTWTLGTSLLPFKII